MIGVAARPQDRDVVREFFELFKTPWEWLVPGKRYRVVLSADGTTDTHDADVALVYCTGEHRIDRRLDVSTHTKRGPADLRWGGAVRLPVYQAVTTFRGRQGSRLRLGDEGADYAATDGSRVWRIGYDLFAEIRHLLQRGQPTLNAQIPTLELHIELIRQLLVESGVAFVEIPPRPFGRDFACCLTHDVDFAGIARHRFDRTLAGFIARASVGTLVDWLRGRRPFAHVVENWRALCALPLVFLKLVPDFWRPLEQYRQVEADLPSTFFVIPFKNQPGVSPEGRIVSARAVAYEASEIATEIRAAVAAGTELGLHGIDAWCGADAGRAERAELARVTGRQSNGVRMHWLYFSDDSPLRLDEAGFDYDSTWGYNETVGYRAGTSQVFQWLGTSRLMELPLSIMDSALLASDRMALTDAAALNICGDVMAQGHRLGGTLVINWHCRSLAPERLWRQPYETLLSELTRDDRVWFATGGDVVAWFRWRRSIQFTADGSRASLRIEANGASSYTGVVRVHRQTGSEDVVLRGTEPCVVKVESLDGANAAAM